MSGGFDMVCNGRRVVMFNEGLEVFSFSIMKSSFCFTDVEIIAIPATGFVKYFRFLRTIQAVLEWKERFDATIILKNYLEVDKRGERERRNFSLPLPPSFHFFACLNLRAAKKRKRQSHVRKTLRKYPMETDTRSKTDTT